VSFSIKRRSFLKLLGIGSAASIISPQSFVATRKPRTLLGTMGRKRGLAQICLMVDELPQGAYARYEADPQNVANVSYHHNDNPLEKSIDAYKNQKIIQLEPQKSMAYFRKVPNPDHAYSPDFACEEVRCASWQADYEREEDVYLIPTGHHVTKGKSKKECDWRMRDMEDRLFLRLFYDTIPKCNHIYFNKAVKGITGKQVIGAVNNCFASVEQHDLLVGKLVVHPQMFKRMMSGLKEIDIERKPLNTKWPSPVGYLWSAQIFVSDLVNPNTILSMAHGEYVGANVYRTKPYYLETSKLKRKNNPFHDTNLYIQESAQFIQSDYAISQLTFV